MKVKIRNLFVVNLLRDIVYLPLWYLQKYIKRDSHLWIFGAWFGNSYSDNSKIVYPNSITISVLSLFSLLKLNSILLLGDEAKTQKLN